MRKEYKIVIVLLVIYTLFFNVNILNAQSDNVAPQIYISEPSSTYVDEGGSITFKLKYTDNVGIEKITLKKDDIVLRGFTATTSAVKNGNVVTLKLTNIKSTDSGSKSILVKAGSAVDTSGNLASQAVSFNFYVNGSNKDTISPTISISTPSQSTVKKGGSVEYIVSYNDDVGIKNITLKEDNITLVGFSANKKVEIISSNKAKITLTNIIGVPGVKSIKISADTAVDSSNNKAPSANSLAFVIIEENINNDSNNGSNNNSNNNSGNTSNKPSVPLGNQNTNTNINNNEDEKIQETIKITSIKTSYKYNENLTSFSTWLRISKNNDRTRLYNVISDGESVNYIIDYYNPENVDKKDVKFVLNIPYEVTVKDKEKYSNVTYTSELGTNVEFVIESIKAKDSGRYIIEVTFKNNVVLKTSDKISEEFYSKLKTTVDEKDTYSYLNQLYIDKSVTKKAYFVNTLLSLDPTNTLRRDDEITRAELSKMLLDTGLITKSNSVKYINYSDYMKVRSYCKTAVSAVAENDIFEIENNMFNPNAPILRDDFFKIIFNVLSKKSNNLIRVQEPLYVIEELVKGSESTKYSKYIMELVRQNILPEEYKYDSLDEYVTRKEALYFVNSLCFRVYMNNYPVYNVDTLNINGYGYVYNFTNNANTSKYVYNYNEDLSINITKK